MLSNKKVAASDSQVPFIYSIQQSSQLTLSNEILPTFSSQVPSVYPIQQNLQYTLGYPNEKSLQPMLSDEALPIFGSQALSVYPNEHSLPNDEILLAFDSQVLFIYSNEQSSQPMLSDEILSASSSQVSSIYSIQQECASLGSNMSNTNDIDNGSVNYDISDVNEQQNVEFEDQEKLEIVPSLVFQNWEQLDRYIRIYAKQNGFVSIITCSESDEITRRRCRYACEHQGISYSKKTVILENQKQSHTKWLGCKWVVNATCPKTTKKIKITSCNLEHSNHEIHPDTINFASYYRQFPDEVKQEIKYYTSKGKMSLSKLVKVLDSQLARESMYIRYNNWSSAHVKPTNITASAQLLPEVDKWLAEFLTLPILSLQRTEIAEALWYSALLVSKESINISLLQEKSKIDFYENLDDFSATNVNEIISNEHYSKSDESLISQPSITYQNGSATSTSNFISDFTLIYPGSDFSFNISKTLNNHRAYGVTNGLCKKAMAVGLDAGSAAMESLNKFLENFIQQYSVNFNQHLVTNTALSKIQDNKLSDLDDQENVPPFDVSTIQDPVIKKRKGAPRVKRIKSSLETKNIQSNTKKEKATRFCSRCKQPNHYAKTCTVDL
ncbi:13814_t:CDS:2 [Cetraspora pellucida]|uniref:13814_t:CDS:1 n=1 Tax=Cetraspora pellucida TaxID=1433469 RepID=A0ACA9KT28_9GLOM|nr:13814_t:CDS:2 [Cetraspora pellucida]